MQQILSREATNEILGDELCFLVAITKSGKAVRFFPHGTELHPDGIQPCEENAESILEISIKIPPMEFSDENCLLGLGLKSKKIPPTARCRCKQDGQWEDC